MERIATDIYAFSELRNGGFTYVDKTDSLLRMASGDVGKQFFIARPRRFGKSLAVIGAESPEDCGRSYGRSVRPVQGFTE